MIFPEDLIQKMLASPVATALLGVSGDTGYTSVVMVTSLGCTSGAQSGRIETDLRDNAHQEFVNVVIKHDRGLDVFTVICSGHTFRL